jgi:hypothetical protein
MGLDELPALEATETVGEDVGRDPLGRTQEVLEAAPALEGEVPEDQERPTVAEHVQAEGDRATGSFPVRTHALR